MMKRFLMILVFGLLLSFNAEAGTENWAKKGKDFSTRNTDPKVKGWQVSAASYYSSGSKLNINGTDNLSFSTISKEDAIQQALSNCGREDCLIISVWYKHKILGPVWNDSYREYLWNDQVTSFLETNPKTLEEKKEKDKKVELASMIEGIKNTCKGLGFTEGTDKFSDCGLKLYTKRLELAARNNQVVQGSMSGGAVTIYDPVRDNRALINQGMKMLSGRCTVGFDC